MDLEELRFRGFAVGFGHGKSHLVGSESALSAIKQQHLTYLHTLVFYGKFFQLISYIFILMWKEIALYHQNGIM